MAQRACLLITFALFATAVLVAPARTAAGATVSFSPLHSGTDVGDTVTVNVTIDAATPDLRGASLVLEFDPAVVAPVSVLKGALVTAAPCPSFLAWLNEPAVGDSLAVDLALLGCSIDGPGHVIELRFTGIAPGFTALECRSLSLRNSLNQTIPASCVPGSITVGPISVEPHTWGRVKAAYRREGGLR